MNGTLHQIPLGDYAIIIDGARVAVYGPDDGACARAEDALFSLLGTQGGALLLGRARLGAGTEGGERALAELAERLGLHYEAAVPASGPAIQGGRSLDYDDDHAKIRALNLPKIYTRTITEFEGMCAALVYDGVIDDEEIRLLTQWMEAKAEFLDAWPLCDVRAVLEHALNDRVVDDAERRALLELLDSIGASAENCGKAAESIFDEHPVVEFSGRSFLFTGRLAMGKRKDAEAAVKSRGGIPAKSVNQKLAYLVVGDLGTDAWQYSRYGRKIEAVMENKRAGLATKIIREADFVDAL